MFTGGHWLYKVEADCGSIVLICEEGFADGRGIECGGGSGIRMFD